MSKTTESRLRTTLGLALAAAIGIGCGVSTSPDEAPTPSQGAAQGRTTTSPTSTTARTRTATTPRPNVPARPSGLVEVAGPRNGSLSQEFVEDSDLFQPEERLRATATTPGETAAFRQLCDGSIDIVESTRKITEQEFAACRRRGLEVLREFKIASDGVIVATKNQSDVGGDCLTVADVRNIFRRGSTIDNWADLGFDNLELNTTGPSEDSTLFTFFSQRVLGIPAGSSLASVRSDYRAREREKGARYEVIGRDDFIQTRRRARELVRQIRRREQPQLERVVDRAIRAADREALREIARINARNRRLRIRVNAEALERSNRRLVENAKRQAQRKVTREFRDAQNKRIQRQTDDLLMEALRPGVVGLFSYSYYTQYEEQLRPMEIDLGRTAAAGQTNATTDTATTPATGARTTATTRTSTTGTTTNVPGDSRTAQASGPQCSFPSEETITLGSYPLAESIVLYTTRSGLARREVRDFMSSFMFATRVLAINNQLVPLPLDVRNDQIEVIEGRRLQRETAGERSTSTGTRSGTTTSPTTTTGTTTAPARTTNPSSSSTLPGISSNSSRQNSAPQGGPTGPTGPTGG